MRYRTIHHSYELSNLSLAIIVILIIIATAPLTVGSECPNGTVNTYKKYCKTIYDIDMDLRYNDNLMNLKEPVHIYRDINDTGHFLISLKRSELHKCEQMSLEKAEEVECERPRQSIHLIEASMYCFDFTIQYAKELVAKCGKNDPKAVVQRVTFHYTMKTNLPSKATRLHWQWSIVFAVYLLLYG